MTSTITKGRQRRAKARQRKARAAMIENAVIGCAYGVAGLAIAVLLAGWSLSL